MVSENKITVLVVDDETEVRELISMTIEATLNAKIIEASSGNKAIDQLKEHPEICLVVCDYRMQDGNGGEVFKYMRTAGLQTPYILISTDAATDHEEFIEKAPYASLVKPMVSRPLKVILNEMSAKGLLSRVSAEGPGELENNTQYCRIKVETLARLGILCIDIYLKLAENHYIKAMKAGESFEEKDYSRFREKQIEFLYFSAEESERILGNLEKSLAALAEAKELNALELAQQHIVPAMDLVRDMSKAFGWDEGLERIVNENVNITVKALGRVPEFAPLLKTLLSRKRKGIADYAASVSYVSCGIVHTLGWVSDLTHYKLTMAAFLQDMTLTDAEVEQMETLELRAQGRSAQVDPELKAFMEHPKKATQFLEKWKNCPPDVDAIVMEHHESPDGKGFPSGHDHTRMSPLAAVQIVARDIVGYYHEKGAAADISAFLISRAELYSHGVFKKIISSLARVIAQD